MAKYTSTEGLFEELLTSGSHPPAATLGDMRGSEAEHVKPKFRDRLALLESLGLLAVGVRAILQENGFTPDIRRRHCRCPTCAQRCSVCAQRHGERA